MTRDFYLIILFCVINIQITFAQQTPPEKKVLIDIANLNGGAVADIFAESEYIPLENTKESQINRIDRLEVTKAYYIVFDNYKTGKILLFNKQGKFVKKITEQILGEFYLENNVTASYEQHFQENEIKTMPKPDSTRYHLTLYNKSKIIANYFPIDTAIVFGKGDNLINSWSGIDVINQSILFVNTGSYKVFNIGINGIAEAYNILFPLKNSLPSDFMINKTYTGKRYQMANDNPDLIFGLQKIYKINNWLFLSAMHWQGGSDRIMYNLKTATALEMKKVQGDETNGYLPIINIQGIVNVDKENIYTCISSAQMFQAKEEMTKKNPVYSKLLQDYFKTSSRLGNPVLIRLKLKADF